MVNMSEAVNNARLIKVEISRAKSYLKRYELVKSIDAMLEVLDLRREMPVMGADKSDIDLMMADYVADFNKNPLLHEFLLAVNFTKKQYIAYSPGMDLELVNKLTAIKLKMAQIEKTTLEREAREHRDKCDQLLLQGEQFTGKKEYPKARVCLKRAAEQYGATPGVLLAVGTILLTGSPKEAVDILRKAVERFPDDPDIHKQLVAAHIALGRLPDAEEAYKAALRQFGDHPQTLLNLAKLQLRMHKRYDAADTAKRAFDLDPGLTEAKEILDRY